MKKYNFIPDELKEAFINKTKILKDSYSMFIDLSGFTTLTENAIQTGKNAVEELIELLNNFFSKAIKIIYKNKGFIAVFHGDAMTAIFKEKESPINLLISFIELKEIFFKEKIKFKAGASFGNIKIHTHAKKEIYFYFSGPAIRNSAKSQSFSHPYQLTVDQSFVNQVLKYKIKGINFQILKNSQNKKKFYNVIFEESFFSNTQYKNIIKNKENNIKSENCKKYRKGEKTKGIEYDNFSNVRLLKEKGYTGEFRNISTIFIKFKNLKDLDTALDFIEPLILKYQGYINSIEDADKGIVLSIFFGAPIGIESPPFNALKFTEALKNALIIKNISFKIGITYGTVFSGIIGTQKRATFTAIGNSVNLAARIMSKSKPLIINCDLKFYNSINKFILDFRSKKYFLKGIKEPINIYQILTIKEKEVEEKYSSKFSGRKTEIKKIIEFLTNSHVNILIISGNAGSGKTRLINEILKLLNNKLSNNDSLSFNIYKFSFESIQTDPFKTFKEFFSSYSDQLKAIIKFNIFEKINNFFALNLKQANKKVLEQNLNLIANIISDLSKIKKSIYIFDNIQWCDQYSKIIINRLLLNLLNPNYNNSKIIFILRGDIQNINLLNENVELNQIFKNINFKTILHIKLKGLTKNEFTEYIKLNNINISRNLLNELYIKTAGNPLFIEYLLNYLNSKKKQKRINIIKLPEKLTDLIIARLDSLSVELKKMLKTASVMGLNFNINVLSLVLKKELDLKLIKNFESIEFIKAISDIIYAFTHDIIRETIYNIQLEKELKKLHYLTAKAIEKIYKNNLNIYIYDLAFHYDKANKKTKAKLYLKKCFNKVLNNYLYLKVIDYGKSLLKYLYNFNEKINIYNILLDSYLNTGNFLEAENFIHYSLFEIYKFLYKKEKNNSLNEMINQSEFTQTEDYDNIELFLNEIVNFLIENKKYSSQFSFHLNNIRKLTNFLIYCGLVFFYQSKYNKALNFYNKAINLSEKFNFKKLRFKAMEKMAGIYFFQNKINIAYKILSELLNNRISKNDSELVSLYSNYAIILKKRGNYKDAINYYTKAIQISKRFRLEPSRLANNYFNLGICYSEIGNNQLAKLSIVKALKIFKKYNNLTGIAVCFDALGDINIYKKKFALALKYKLKSYEIEKKLNIPFYMLYTLITIVNIYIEQKQFDKANDFMLKITSLIEKVKNPEYKEMFEIIKLKLETFKFPENRLIKAKYNGKIKSTKLKSFIRLIN